MNKTRQISRREFLKAASTLTAAAPFIIPSRVWGADAAPGDRLTMGFIGMGTQSRGLLSNFLHQETRVVAVCDVDTTRRNDAKKKVDKHYGNSDCQRHTTISANSLRGKTSTRSASPRPTTGTQS